MVAQRRWWRKEKVNSCNADLMLTLPVSQTSDYTEILRVLAEYRELKQSQRKRESPE